MTGTIACRWRQDAARGPRCGRTEDAGLRSAPTTDALCGACLAGAGDDLQAWRLAHFAAAKAAAGFGWFPLETTADAAPDPSKCLRVLETHTPSCGCSQLRTYRCHRGDGVDWRRCQHMDNGRPCGEYENAED